METILDHHVTPLELHSLGFTELPDDPLTDEIRAEILAGSADGNLLSISDLMFMRDDDEQGYAYLRRFPPNHPGRVSREEIRAEWSIMDRAA